MTNFLSQLNRGPGYPVLSIESPTGYKGMQESLSKRVERDRPIVIINVRKYGLDSAKEGIPAACELLFKLGQFIRVSEMIGGVFVTINPKSGYDGGTITSFQRAWETAATPVIRATYNQRAPLCVLHVTQPEGSPNSWTGGISAPAALAMHMVRRSEWHRTWIWNLSGEVEIDFDEMAKAEQMLAQGVRPLTFRESPKWLHPAMERFHGFDDGARYSAILSEMSKLIARQCEQFGGLEGEATQALLAQAVPFLRNTCSWTSLRDLDVIGLPDRRCNEGQGMEDWLHNLHWMTCPKGLLHGVSSIPQGAGQLMATYRDSRITEADQDATARPKEVSKFARELLALETRFTQFIAERATMGSVPVEHQEFHMP